MAEARDPGSEAKATASTERKACPICGKPRDPHYHPFCSKRCADVDLHHWLSGAYVVPGAPTSPDEPEGEAD